MIGVQHDDINLKCNITLQQAITKITSKINLALYYENHEANVQSNILRFSLLRYLLKIKLDSKKKNESNPNKSEPAPYA